MRVVVPACLAAIVASTFASSPAPADALRSSRFDGIEKEHVVDVKIARGTARFVVRRTVQNTGDKSDQAIWRITPPEGGVAIGLRTAGAKKNGELEWFTGELMEAEAAAAKYRELTGIGGYYPKDPALLSWRGQGDLALQVFPVPGKGEKTIEYTLLVPTTYEQGAHVLNVPNTAGEGTMPATLRVSAEGEDEIWMSGMRLANGTAIVHDRKEPLRFELRPRKPAPLEGHLASLSVAKNRAATHVRLFTAERISTIPARAAVAIVIDGSRSMRGSFPSARAAARSFIGHFPNAEVDVITFDRKVYRRTPSPVTPREALTVLHKLPDDGANGSRLDDAIQAADALLAQRASPERRMLVLTDTLTREALTPKWLAARTLKSGATLHMADVREGAAKLERDDEDEWAPIAKNTGGVFWHATHPERGDRDSQAVFEEWVRPLRIDYVRVRGATASAEWPTTLAEGEGFEDWSLAKFVATAVTVQGQLWSRPFSTRIATTPAASKLSAALVFGDDLHSQLSEPEMMILAKRGGAVSPVTSYLAIEPGVRPSTEGLDWGEGGGGSGSGLGLGGIGTLGRGTGGGMVDLKKHREGMLSAAARKCKARGEMSIELETTVDEIVEIGSVEQRATRDATVEGCVREEVWAHTLPSSFAASHARFSVAAKL